MAILGEAPERLSVGVQLQLLQEHYPLQGILDVILHQDVDKEDLRLAPCFRSSRVALSIESICASLSQAILIGLYHLTLASSWAISLFPAISLASSPWLKSILIPVLMVCSICATPQPHPGTLLSIRIATFLSPVNSEMPALARRLLPGDP